MTIMPDKFEKVPLKSLPERQKPKYKIGDLVFVQPGSGKHTYGFYLKEGMGVVIGIEAFKIVGFESYSPKPIYLIEYKIKWAEKDSHGYVPEHSVFLVETDDE
tara:strand:+ start:798 stop:1106 length:309 start_codon:yes stop_codon:yes gene_type:complete